MKASPSQIAYWSAACSARAATVSMSLAAAVVADATDQTELLQEALHMARAAQSSLDQYLAHLAAAAGELA